MRVRFFGLVSERDGRRRSFWVSGKERGYLDFFLLGG